MSDQFGTLVGGFDLPPALTPKVLVFNYSPTEWERFIYEWANELEPEYFDVAELGGPNDEGLDIVGTYSSQGIEGVWDCFQCKHYERDLEPADAYREILKLLAGVVNGRFSLPRAYRFVSPRGCKPALERLLQSPTKLRQGFLNYVSKKLPKNLQKFQADVPNIRALAETIDFGIFKSLKIDDILQTHGTSPHHSRRFGFPLPARPQPDPPPADIADTEARYVSMLVDVYSEESGGSIQKIQDVLEGSKHAVHFQ